MVHKKTAIIFIVLFFLIISLSFIFRSPTSFHKIRLSMTNLFNPGRIETNFTLAVIRLIEGENEILVQNKEENVCYWITPTRDKGYYLEIKKYGSETKECHGKILEESMIPTDKPIDIIARTKCLCSDEIIIKRLDEETGTFLKIISV